VLDLVFVLTTFKAIVLAVKDGHFTPGWYWMFALIIIDALFVKEAPEKFSAGAIQPVDITLTCRRAITTWLRRFKLLAIIQYFSCIH
jgi:hypothetical protein